MDGHDFLFKRLILDNPTAFLIFTTIYFKMVLDYFSNYKKWPRINSNTHLTMNYLEIQSLSR